MRCGLFVLLPFWLVASGTADDAPRRAASAHEVLAIDRSSMKIPGGKATLIIGSLRRTNDIFGGEFQMKVVPYFFKNDQGTLAIIQICCQTCSTRAVPHGHVDNETVSQWDSCRWDA